MNKITEIWQEASDAEEIVKAVLEDLAEDPSEEMIKSAWEGWHERIQNKDPEIDTKVGMKHIIKYAIEQEIKRLELN